METEQNMLKSNSKISTPQWCMMTKPDSKINAFSIHPITYLINRVSFIVSYPDLFTINHLKNTLAL